MQGEGCTHTLHTGTPGAVNVGGERTRKCWYGPHILVVLRMADLCGQVRVNYSFPVTAPEKATRGPYAPDSFAKAWRSLFSAPIQLHQPTSSLTSVLLCCSFVVFFLPPVPAFPTPIPHPRTSSYSHCCYARPWHSTCVLSATGNSPRGDKPCQPRDMQRQADTANLRTSLVFSPPSFCPDSPDTFDLAQGDPENS